MHNIRSCLCICIALKRYSVAWFQKNPEGTRKEIHRITEKLQDVIFSYLCILQLRAYSDSFMISLHRLCLELRTNSDRNSICYSHLISITSFYLCTSYSINQKTPNLSNIRISEFHSKLSSVETQDTAKYLEQQKESNSLFKHTGISLKKKFSCSEN